MIPLTFTLHVTLMHFCFILQDIFIPGFHPVFGRHMPSRRSIDRFQYRGPCVGTAIFAAGRRLCIEYVIMFGRHVRHATRPAEHRQRECGAGYWNFGKRRKLYKIDRFSRVGRLMIYVFFAAWTKQSAVVCDGRCSNCDMCIHFNR